MKQANLSKILLATDFSESANIAGEVAATLASALKADLHVIHVLETSVYKSVMPEIDITTFAETPVSKSVENRLNQYTEELGGGSGRNVVAHFQLGDPSDLVTEAAKQIDVNLIVTGAHGVKGFRRFFAGSNTYRIVTNSRVPVLSVPAHSRSELKKILLPFDESLSTLEKTPWAALLAGASGGTVQILGVLKHHDKEQQNVVKGHVDAALKFLSEHRIPANHFYEEGDNYAEVVLDFCGKSGSDAVCIMSDKKKKLTGIFPGGFAHQIIHQSQVPVLTVQPEVQ